MLLNSNVIDQNDPIGYAGCILEDQSLTATEIQIFCYNARLLIKPMTRKLYLFLQYNNVLVNNDLK